MKFNAKKKKKKSLQAKEAGYKKTTRKIKIKKQQNQWTNTKEKKKKNKKTENQYNWKKSQIGFNFIIQFDRLRYRFLWKWGLYCTQARDIEKSQFLFF